MTSHMCRCGNNTVIPFAWQPQHLVRFMVGSCSDRSRIGNDVSAVFSKFLSDVGWSFCVAGAAFGEVHVSLFVAGAACGEICNDSRSGKRCNFQ